MPTTHPHGHPALSARLARIEHRDARHRALAVLICFCLPALAAVTIAAASVLNLASASEAPASGLTDVEEVAR